MWNLEYSGQFKKDLKRMAKRSADIEALREVLHILERKGQVPSSYRPHILSGNWQGVWECHIGPDWLLLYDVNDCVRVIRLVRTGSHSDIF